MPINKKTLILRTKQIKDFLMSEKLSIKDWAIEDRPREKMISKGVMALSEAELIAILIGSGNATESAVELSRRILQSTQNNLNKLGKYRLADFTQFKGIGEAKGVTIMAALELGRRRKACDVVITEQIKSSDDAYNIIMPILLDLSHEEFWIILLNQAHRVISKHRISVGGVSSTTADIKIIMRHVVTELASAIVLCHNHPSGTPKPSPQDIELTKKIKSAAENFDSRVLDHIIVFESGFYSFADEGLL